MAQTLNTANGNSLMTTSQAVGRKAVAYARVSSKEQEKEGFSIPAQIKLLTEYARTEGLEIVCKFIDVETAKAAGRTQFDAMVKFISTRPDIANLLVEKTDRLYRNFKDYVRLEDLNRVVHLVKEHEVLGPTSRSHTKFIHGIKVLMAKNYIDNLSEEVKKGHREKAEQGGYPAKAPLGYRNNTQTGHVEVHPATAPFVQRMFTLAAQGHYSFQQIRTQIVTDGLVYHSPKVTFALSHVKRILRNPFYTGSFLWNGMLYKGRYEPLISSCLFEQAQTAMSDRQKPKYRKHTFAFGGLLVCGQCGCLVTTERKKGRYVYYHCTKSKTPCDEVYYREEDLAPQFDAIVQRIAIGPEMRNWLIQALKESHEEETAYHQETSQRLQEALCRVKHRMDQIYLDKLDGKVSERFWMEKSGEWEVERDRIIDQIRSHQGADQRYHNDGIRLLELASRAYELYAKQSAEQKNKFLRIMLSNCTLKGGMLHPAYKKPFDILARGVESMKWGE